MLSEGPSLLMGTPDSSMEWTIESDEVQCQGESTWVRQREAPTSAQTLEELWAPWTAEAPGDGAITGVHAFILSVYICCPDEMQLCMYEMLEIARRTGQTWCLVFDSTQGVIDSRQWHSQCLMNTSHTPSTIRIFYAHSCAQPPWVVHPEGCFIGWFLHGWEW